MTLGELSTEWSVIFAVLALMAGFLVGQGMDAVMGRQGFGVFGNMIVLSGGFYLGLVIVEPMRLGYDGVEIEFAFGVAGAFCLLFLLALLKRVLLRG